jgi:hypothetical protein
MPELRKNPLISISYEARAVVKYLDIGFTPARGRALNFPARRSALFVCIAGCAGEIDMELPPEELRYAVDNPSRLKLVCFCVGYKCCRRIFVGQHLQ